MPGTEPKALPAPRAKKQKKAAASVRPANVMPGGVWFAPAQPPAAMTTTTAIVEVPAKPQKPKTDPRLIAASRELRDRWLEQVNASPVASAAGKYDVGRRQIEGDVVDGEVVAPRKRLAA